MSKLVVTRRGKPIRQLRPMAPTQRKQTKQLIKRELMSSSETKIADCYQSYFNINRTALFYKLSYNSAGATEIIQGLGQQQRVGNKIKLSSVELRYNIYFDSSAVVANPQHTARVIMFRWNDDISVNAPSVTQLLQYPTTGIGFYQDITSPYQYSNHQQGLFTILYDKVHNIGEGCNGVFKLKRKALNSDIKWENAVAVSGTGHIYLMVVADDATGGVAPQLWLQYHSRIRYTDA